MGGKGIFALSDELKAGRFSPAYYLHGPEHRLKDDAVRAIVEAALDPSVRDFNLDIRSAPKLDGEEIESLCSTLPMMADRRVVVLREVEGWQKRAKGKAAMMAYLEKPSPDTVVVLVQGDDEKPDPDLTRSSACTLLACDRLDARRAASWATRRAREQGVELEPAAIEHLVRALDADLGAMASELEKLAGLGGGAPVTVTQLEGLLGIRHGETQIDWRDAVLQGEGGRAASLLEPLLSQPAVSGVRLVMLLGQSLIGIGIARAHLDAGRRGRALESEMFGVLKRTRQWGIDYRETAALWARAAEDWPRARVRAALLAARRADEQLKTTTVSDERGILVDLVMQLSHRLQVVA